jgi:hypothetical protein
MATRSRITSFVNSSFTFPRKRGSDLRLNLNLSLRPLGAGDQQIDGEAVIHSLTAPARDGRARVDVDAARGMRFDQPRPVA